VRRSARIETRRHADKKSVVEQCAAAHVSRHDDTAIRNRLSSSARSARIETRRHADVRSA
jgi:hypothetical protein